MKKDFYVVGYPNITREELDAGWDKFTQLNRFYSGTEIYIPKSRWMEWKCDQKELKEAQLVMPGLKEMIPKWRELFQKTHIEEEKKGWPCYCPVKCTSISFIYKDEFYGMGPGSIIFPDYNEIMIAYEFSIIERDIIHDLYQMGVTYAEYFDMLD